LVLANRRKLAVELVSSEVPPRGRILDAGCGAGLVARDLAELGFFVHGMDIAEPKLEPCASPLSMAPPKLPRGEATTGSALSFALEQA
jgi:hypothetical protein